MAKLFPLLKLFKTSSGQKISHKLLVADSSNLKEIEALTLFSGYLLFDVMVMMALWMKSPRASMPLRLQKVDLYIGTYSGDATSLKLTLMPQIDA